MLQLSRRFFAPLSRTFIALKPPPLKTDPGMENREERQQDRGDPERHNSVSRTAVDRPKNKAAEQRGPGPKDENAAAMTMAQCHKAVMEVALVGI